VEVLALIAVRDRNGDVSPRGKILDLGQGRLVFFRDLDPERSLIRAVGGYAIESGVLRYLEGRGVGRVHYRERGGPLLAADTATFALRGAPWNKNGRAQYVLPLGKWTRFPPARAYDPPVVEMPWTVVDHRSGKVVAP